MNPYFDSYLGVWDFEGEEDLVSLHPLPPIPPSTIQPYNHHETLLTCHSPCQPQETPDALAHQRLRPDHYARLAPSVYLPRVEGQKRPLLP